MQGSKTKSGSAEAKSNGKPKPDKEKKGGGGGGGTPPTPKDSRPRKPAVPKASAAGHGTPRSADKSPGSGSADRKAPTPKAAAASRLATPPEKQGGKPTKPSQEQQQAAKPAQELQAQLAAVREDLVKAKEQLVENEKEKGRVLAELERAKKAADEANAKLQEAQGTDKLPAGESEQANMHGQQEADAAALRSTVEQLEKARYELADALDAKNEALSQVDEAVRASEVKALEVKLLTAEVKRLKELVDSKLDGRGKKTAERIQNLEAENSALKLKLEKAKAAEEKAIQLERMVNELKSDADDARKSGSKSEQLADEWQKKAELLEARLEEADQSNILKGESLNSAMEELDSTSSLLRDRESEVAVLQDKVRFLDDELAKLKSDIDVSGQRTNAAEKEAADLWTEVEGLRLKLRTAEEEKIEALNSDKYASSEIETLNEQKNQLADELEATKDELEKVKKAMEGLASALQEMSAESREAQEKYLLKQDEIERAQAQVEELSLSLKNTKENYELMLDEANYEKVCLTKSVERLESEAKGAHEEWQSKELSFVNSIKNSEEEIGAIRVQMNRTLEVVKEKENENTELQEKLQQLESQLMEANRIREQANAETIQWKEKVLDQENELQNIKQENDDLQAKESAASQKIKELSSQFANTKDGTTNGNAKEGDNEKGDTEDEDEPVVVVSKMWENSKFADYDSSKEKENDGDSQVDLESNKGDAGLDSNGLHSAKDNSGRTSPTKQHQQHKKKPLLKRFGGLLKKKSEN
ncbi:WEB family protein At5g16730, chloroplastic-like [Miscanthus floridulus]|uniref:WEB family protein At5g16730, chloroplastic-like n=1 Tax=Miscanthus floridulus TaxID=154761 RepID=UPI00345B4B23